MCTARSQPVTPRAWPPAAVLHGRCRSGSLGHLAGNTRRWPFLRRNLCEWQRELVKNPPAMRETWVQSLGWEDPPGVGKGYPLQYSGLEHSMGCIVHGVTKSWTRLSDFHLEGAAPRRERWVETHRTLGSGILSNSSGPA